MSTSTLIGRNLCCRIANKSLRESIFKIPLIQDLRSATRDLRVCVLCQVHQENMGFGKYGPLLEIIVQIEPVAGLAKLGLVTTVLHHYGCVSTPIVRAKFQKSQNRQTPITHPRFKGLSYFVSSSKDPKCVQTSKDCTTDGFQYFVHSLKDCLTPIVHPRLKKIIQTLERSDDRQIAIAHLQFERLFDLHSLPKNQNPSKPRHIPRPSNFDSSSKI